MRLIDAEKLFESVGAITPRNKEHHDAIGEFMNLITNSPTIAKHKDGKWIVESDGFIFKRQWGICSECGHTLDFAGLNAGRGNANYCPNCGAYMRGEDNEID